MTSTTDTVLTFDGPHSVEQSVARQDYSLVSPTETDGERLRWQASHLGAVYAQVQETPTLLSERS